MSCSFLVFAPWSVSLPATGTFVSFLQPEVARRKTTVFRRTEQQVKVILSEEHTRASILTAYSLYTNALRLIDHELNWLDNRNTDEDEDAPVDSFFAAERSRLTRDEEAYPPLHPAFFILPLSFYITLEGELVVPKNKNVDAAVERKALWLWGAEDDHMSFFYETEGWNPYYTHPKHPFRKYSML